MIVLKEHWDGTIIGVYDNLDDLEAKIMGYVLKKSDCLNITFSLWNSKTIFCIKEMSLNFPHDEILENINKVPLAITVETEKYDRTCFELEHFILNW